LDDAKCTDVFCLLLFVLYWLVMVIIFLAGWATGDLASLVYGADHAGNRCGQKEFEQRPYIWYPRIAQDLAMQHYALVTRPWEVTLYGVCVSECPKLGDGPIADYEQAPPIMKSHWDVNLDTINAVNRCIPTMHRNTSQSVLCVKPTCQEAGKECFGGNVLLVPANTWLMQPPDYGICDRQMDLSISTETKQPNVGPILESALHFAAIAEETYESIAAHSWTIAAFGIGLPTILGFCWMVFLFLCAHVAVYLALALIVIFLLLGAVLCAYKGGVTDTYINDMVTHYNISSIIQESGYANVVENSLVQSALKIDEKMQDVYKWAGILLAVLLLLLLIFLCLMGKQIHRTASLVREGTKVIRNSPAIVVFPIFVASAQLIMIIFVGVAIAFLWSDPAQTYKQQLEWLGTALNSTASAVWSGQVVLPESTFSFLTTLGGFDRFQVTVIETVFMLFGALWTYWFLFAIQVTTVAGCVVYYYFVDWDTSGVKDQKFKDNQTNLVTITMFLHTLKNNLGTMAFGSLILASIEGLRLFMEFLDRQTQAAQNANALVLWILKCCKCFLFCFEKSVKMLTEFAYTFVQLENYNFCWACYESLQLLERSTGAVKQVTVNKIVQVVLFCIQSTVIPIASTVACYRVLILTDEEVQSGAATSLNYLGPIAPSVLVLILSYVMARSFAGVYEQTITSLTICVLYDREEFITPYITEGLYKAFDFEPDWKNRKVAKARKGTDENMKHPAKKFPMSKRKMIAGSVNKATQLHDYKV